MLGITYTMTDQVKQYSVNNTLSLENVLNLNYIKTEEYQDDGYTDDKIDISETTIIKHNDESQDPLLPDQMKEYNICTTGDNIKRELPFSEVQHDNLKIEEGISANNIKIEFNNGFLYCEDCHVYYEEYCAQCGMLVHVLNRTAPINDEKRAQKELPCDTMLEIQDYFGKLHVFALKAIPVGVKFGPFVGLNKTEHLWRIKAGKFVVNKDKLKYLNWMQYINPARNISEQNLLVFQYEHNVYYQSTRQIDEGDELLVYFGEEFEDSFNTNIEMDFVPAIKHILKDTFACTFCCLGFSSKSYLTKHKTICPKNMAGGSSIEELMQCPYCKIHMDRKEYILHNVSCCCERNHSVAGDNPVAAENSLGFPKEYHCSHCKYKTNYPSNFLKHCQSHKCRKSYKCAICSKLFKRKPDFKRHIRTHTGEKPYECDKCRRRFTDKSNLTSHLKYKHKRNNEQKYVCGHCSYTSVTSYDLKRHLQIHSDSREIFNCETCNKKFTSKANLKRHMNTHLKYNNSKYKHKRTNEQKYVCGYCSYTSVTRYGLKRHLQIHSDSREMFNCETCNKKFTAKANLKRHINIHLKYEQH